VAALPDQWALALEKERGLDRAMAIPARKVFWEAVPVAEVAAQVLRDQASSVLRRVNAAFYFLLKLKHEKQNGLPHDSEQSVHRGRWSLCSARFGRGLRNFRKEMFGLRCSLDSTLHAIRVLSRSIAIPLAGVLRGSDCTR
jgi:hypothetical protein